MTAKGRPAGRGGADLVAQRRNWGDHVSLTHPLRCRCNCLMLRENIPFGDPERTVFPRSKWRNLLV